MLGEKTNSSAVSFKTDIALDAIDIPAALITSQGEIIEVNQAWKQQPNPAPLSRAGHGRWSDQNFILELTDELPEKAYAESFFQALNTLVQEKKTLQQFNYFYQDKDHTRHFLVKLSCHPTLENKYLMLHLELTNLFLLQTQNPAFLEAFIHGDRLSQMGTLALSLAHEMSQPLTSIANYCQVGIEKTQKTPVDAFELKTLLDHAYYEAERASEIIRRLRDFVRKQKPRQASVNINHAILEAVALVRNELKLNNIELQLELSSQAKMIVGDQVLLQQVFVNLLFNSIQAIKNEAANKPRLIYITSAPTAGDTSVLIHFKDAGPGLLDNLTSHVFSPFVTSKQENMGLGLAVCHRIVSSHRGRIWHAPENALTLKSLATFVTQASDKEPTENHPTKQDAQTGEKQTPLPDQAVGCCFAIEFPLENAFV